ncbi:MAG: Flagellar M-ring protein [Bacteriovoracaceae bacterium]|nr:Flagellar M-ring protein [Bacteriovoracaceae bacterium]
MEFLLNFNSWFKALPAAGKMSLFLVLLGAIIAGFLLKSHYETAGYQYLFTNLTLTDANAISERLQSMNVQVEMKGDAILVPGNRVLELRNMLASEGLPNGGGVGFEIFDRKNFGETEFQQRINYVRAVQGELARTIQAIDGVEKARVHIVIPEKALFAEDNKSPTASVAITLNKGRKLNDAQVNGIVHMMVTSVEGLTEAGINVIDQNGNVLFKASGDEKGGGTKNLELQSNIEKRLESGVRNMLERIVGAGGVSVKVSSIMNFSQIEKMVESVDPESRVALSENTTTETTSGTSGSPGGAPGAASNVPGGTGQVASQARNENSKKTETTATYAVTKSTQKTLEPVGAIQKLSVAVLVDGNYTTAEDGKQTYQPRTAEEITKIEEIVKNAVGYNKERGDQVKVENMQFQKIEINDKAQDAYVENTTSARWKMFLFDNAKLMGVVLIAGIIFFMLVKLVNSYAPPVNVAYANIIGQQAGQIAEALPRGATVNITQRNDPAARERTEQLAKQIPETNQRKGEASINIVESNQSITIESPVTSEEKLRLQGAKIQTEQIIKSDINEAVQVVRSWMNEG